MAAATKKKVSASVAAKPKRAKLKAASAHGVSEWEHHLSEGVPGRSIGFGYQGWLDQDAILNTGLPTVVIENFHRATLWPLNRIVQLAGISTATYNRRKQSGRLSTQESG